MEMDRQTIMVLCCAIIGLTLFGGVYLSSPKSRDTVVRHAYAQDDIRYKLQQEDLKKPKTKKPKPAAQPVISSSESSGGGDVSSDEESNEEPSISDSGDTQEEPPLE
jgi:hypothetical protein